MIYKSIYLARRNPAIAPEDWPRAWRSHPKAVSQIPGAGARIGAAIATIDYCARVRDPQADGAPVALAGVSTEHDGVAIVSSPSEDLHAIGRDRTGQEAVIADEVRVFGRPADQFSLSCVERAAFGDARGQAAVIRFLARRAGVSDADLEAGWRAAAERGRAKAAPGRDVLNAVVGARPAGYDFDAVSEAWFATAQEATRALADGGADALAEVCDPQRGVTLLTEVIFRVPRDAAGGA